MTRVAQEALGWARRVVAPYLVSARADHQLGRALIRSAASLGLLGIQIPTHCGGLGQPFSTKVEVAEALAQVDFGTAMAVINSHNVAEQLVRLGCTELVNRVVARILLGELVACTALTEPGTGSDFSAIQTKAIQTAEGWRLDGAKKWIINANYADLVVVYAQTKPGSGAAGVAAFLVSSDRAGFARHEDASLNIVPSLGTGAFSLDGYVCGRAELISPPGEAFKDILRSINGARVYVAAMCCGMVTECLEIAAHYGRRRQAFGKPLAAHQGWRWALADASTDLEAARHLVRYATALIDAGDDAQVAAAHAKVFATRMAQRHVSALMHAMGAEGLRDEYPFVRHLQSVQVASLTDGSTEMLLERIAREVSALAKP